MRDIPAAQVAAAVLAAVAPQPVSAMTVATGTRSSPD
jgi:hypothetical protein